MSEPIQLICPACSAINRVPAQKLGAGPLCGKCRQSLLSGQPLAVNDQNFRRHIDNAGLPVVVDFWATWCGPCQQFAPVFSEVAGQFREQASFLKLDTEANPNTARQFQIRSIPTLMVFHQGKEIARLAGAFPKGQFVQWLHQQLP